MTIVYKKTFIAFAVAISLLINYNLYAQTPIINTVAGNGTYGFSGDGGLAVSAELAEPFGVATDDTGNIYIADTYNNVIRKVSIATGKIYTIAGNDTQGYAGDGGPAVSAELHYPYAVALDGSNNLYIADEGNNRIRKVTVSTGYITTVAGNGTSGYSGDNGLADSAELASPSGVVVDAAGDIYIGDIGNNRIRIATVANGHINTFAGSGTGGFMGDGSAASLAELDHPYGLALDAAGNVYVADQGNNRIREINISTSVINTVAGEGGNGFTGDGSLADSAQINGPTSVAIRANGNILIADVGNSSIREVNVSTGLISTVIGHDSLGYSGDGGHADSAGLNNPHGVTVGATGNVYVADAGDQRIREVTGLPTAINNVRANAADISVYPNPANGLINLILDGNGYNSLKIFNVLGQGVYTQTLNATEQNQNLRLDVSHFTNGIYIFQAMSAAGPVSMRVLVEH